MKKIIIFCLFFLVIILTVNAQDPKMDGFISKLMEKMTVEEKIGQLNLTTSGDFVTGSTKNTNIERKIRAGQIGSVLNSFSIAAMKAMQDIAVKESPNKIPILYGMDVIHGFKTIFPIPLAMSCSWDIERIEGAARIAAIEATSSGISWTYSPMVDIARDPRWGRIAEGSGEDPWLGSRIAEALVRGYQGSDLKKNNTMIACVKHFALYGAAEAGRDYNTVDMSKITMYNDFLPPYKAAFDAGAGSAMTSFNVVDAVPASGNKWLLTKLLRDDWGFKGFVVTDYTAINEMIAHGMGNLQEVSAMALNAGTDMDMVGEGFLTTLKKSLEEGKVTMQSIDLACRRVLEAKYKLGLFDDPYLYLNEGRASTNLFTPANRKAARELAARSIVLLKNDKQLLPLQKAGTIALIGPLADSKKDMLGTWAMGGDVNTVSSVLDGLKNAAGSSVNILYAKGSEYTNEPMLAKSAAPAGQQRMASASAKSADDLLKEAIESAKKADVVVAVLGEAVEWSGEAASRSDLNIPKSQQDLLKALIETGKPVVLVLVNGRPLTLTWEDASLNSIVEAWAAGTESGNAIADVLFGDYNPAGKLTTTFPRSVGQIPLYYNHKNTGRPMSQDNKYSSKYLDIQNDPLYPFGYGLSYSTFTFSEITLNKSKLKGNEPLTAKISITNTGKFAGEEVVQLYLRDAVASISRPVKELKNFKKIMLQPGETKDVLFEVRQEDLKFYNSELKLDWESGEFTIFIGPNSRDVKSTKFDWQK